MGSEYFCSRRAPTPVNCFRILKYLKEKLSVSKESSLSKPFLLEMKPSVVEETISDSPFLFKISDKVVLIKLVIQPA